MGVCVCGGGGGRRTNHPYSQSVAELRHIEGAPSSAAIQ